MTAVYEHFFRGNAQASPGTVYMSLHRRDPKSPDYSAVGEPVAGQSGAAASIVAGAGAGDMRVTGLTGMTAESVGRNLELSGAASGGNNGTFPISVFVDANTVDVTNGAAVVPDGNNGAISWQERYVPSELGSGIGYARQAITFDPPALSGSGDFLEMLNDAVLTFGPATSDWPGVTHFGIHDAVSAGNLLDTGKLSPGAIVPNGQSYQVGIGEVTLRAPLIL